MENLHYQASIVESNYTEGWIDGNEKGIEKGLQEGKQLGLQEGKEAGLRLAISNLESALPGGIITQELFESMAAPLREQLDDVEKAER